jgi:hypothetical protein
MSPSRFVCFGSTSVVARVVRVAVDRCDSPWVADSAGGGAQRRLRPVGHQVHGQWSSVHRSL